MSGPEMLLQAALKAFVPKETAANITTAIEGMLKDGSLDGIAALVTDIRAIKESLARIEFQNGRIFAEVQSQQLVHPSGKGDDLPACSATGPVYTLAPNDGPVPVAGPGDGGGASGEPDGVRGEHANAAE